MSAWTENDVRPTDVVDLIDDEGALRGLGPAWNDLLGASGSDTLFLTWEWMSTWWRHLAGRRRLAVLAVRRGDRLIALAPLALRPSQIGRLAPFKALEFLGTGTVGSDYLDVILREGCEAGALQALAARLAAGKIMLDLGQVRAGSPPIARLAQRFAERGWSLSRSRAGSCPYIDLSCGTWENYLAGLGPAHRYNIQRRIRNLSRASSWSFTAAATDADRREYLGHLIDLHTLRWRERGGSDAFHRTALIAFHEEFSAIALRRGWLRLFLLRLDGKPAAALYGFRYGRTFYFYQSGFHPAHARQSVGLVALALTIQSAVAEGALEFDLLHGEESYKFLWTRRFREIERLEIYPPAARGALHRGANGFGRGARRLARRALPRTLASWITAALESRREDSTCSEVS